MADSKVTTKTIGGGTLVSTPKISNSETANQYGFAAIKSDGSVVAWGQNATVPDSLNGTIDAVQIYSSKDSFVVLRTDGALIPLGNQSIDAATLKKLDGTIDVTSVFSPGYGEAFFAIRADGSVVAWGNVRDNNWKAIPISIDPVISKQLDGSIDTQQIYSTGKAFAALRNDGSVVAWSTDALESYGINKVAKQLDGTIDVVQIYQNGDPAFAALRADGSVVTWGDGKSVRR